MNSYETTRQPHLAKQSLEHTNFDQLNSLTPEVISRQATINIGTIGHVAHGKSTIVKSLSGVSTGKFGKEKQQNMTMKLGYANAKIFECDNAACPRPGRYCSGPSDKVDVFPCQRPGCGGQFRLVRHLSFVDCPGHGTFMAAMLNGAAIMDAALLVIAGNEQCPQPQTAEHLAAAEIMKLNSIIIIQTKLDLIGLNQAQDSREQIQKFVQNTTAQNAPIIPISAQFNHNTDAICDYIVRKIPVPVKDFTSKPRMTIVRSFDINKPGSTIDDLKGGIIGGSISKGIFKINQEIEIRPGFILKTDDGKIQCRPIRSKITSLLAEQNELAFAVPGGLIGVGTNIDPAVCRADGLLGHLVGEVGTLPKVYMEITITYSLFRRLINARGDAAQQQNRLSGLAQNEILLINIGSLATGGRVIGVKRDTAKIQLYKPVCAEILDKISISRRIQGHYRLIGWGEIRKGEEVETLSCLQMSTSD